jgi:hypothetical protein
MGVCSYFLTALSVLTVRKTPYDVRFIKIKEIDILRPIGIYFRDNNKIPHMKTLYKIALGICKKHNKQL